MDYIGNILCLEYSEIVPEIITESNYHQLKSRGNITVRGRGGNGSAVLIEFESLPDRFKVDVVKTFGDAYEYASKQPILNSIERDFKAEKFFTEYTLHDGGKIPNTAIDVHGKAQINYVERYTQNASWLNLLVRLTDDKRQIKQELNITMESFWKLLETMLSVKNDKFPHQAVLPKSRKKLQEKIKNYKTTGYECLIVDRHKWGNPYAKKVDEGQLKTYLMQRNRHDDTVIAKVYNDWATEQNLPTIDPATVGYWRGKWKSELLEFQLGKNKAKSILQKKIATKNASAPLVKIESDDNDWDVYFYKPETITKRNGKTVIIPENKWFRLALYIVKDNYNGLILGYAAGHTVTKDLVYAAYRDANRYVRKMTGGDYLWHQIQTDRWGVGVKGKKTELEQYYEAQAPFTPAPAGHSWSKRIEASFGTVHHQLLKQMFPKNYAGHNIKAAEQLNPETLDHRNFPHINEAPRMVADWVQAMRNAPRKRCKKRNCQEACCNTSREQEWIEAFNASEKSKQRLISTEQRLQLFGVMHDHLNQIDDYGVRPTLKDIKGNSVEMHYELSQTEIFRHHSKKVQVYYDPADLSEVYITDGKSFRKTVYEFDKPNNAIADQTDMDRKRLNSLQTEQKTLGTLIEDWANEGVTQRMLMDTESRIKANVLDKAVAYEDRRVLDSKGTISIEQGSTSEQKKNPRGSKGSKGQNRSIYDLM